MDNELFKMVLGEGEEILKTYSPNKFRAFFPQILGWAIFIVIGIALVACTYASKSADGSDRAAAIVYLVMFVVLAAICLLLTALWCNKTVYAITNKRVLIRTGRIGVDYKSLDFAMLGAVTVNVSWIDKLLGKNTGVIQFGSMSSPLVGAAASRFSYLYIKQPYEVYKEVKAIIDGAKNTTKDTETK